MTQEPPERPLDLMSLFEALDRHGVQYLVIGGVAAQVHGHRRTTKDLDLVPEPSKENLRRLAAALDELEARVARPTVTTTTASTFAAVVPPLTTKHGEVHIIKEPKGASTWPAMRSGALVVDLEGIEVAIVGLDDLIRMKRASGREADLADIAVLTALEEGAEDEPAS